MQVATGLSLCIRNDLLSIQKAYHLKVIFIPHCPTSRPSIRIQRSGYRICQDTPKRYY